VIKILNLILKNGKDVLIVRCLFRKHKAAIIWYADVSINSVLFVFVIGLMIIIHVLDKDKIGFKLKVVVVVK